jgi:hypothetical protein
VFALAKALMSVEPLSATEIDAVIAQSLQDKRSPPSKPANGDRSPGALRRSPRKHDPGNMDARREREQLLSQPCISRHPSEIGPQLTRNNVIGSERNPASRVMCLR